ncbi:MAG: sulfite exporter TauE/SafE family protein [Ignavibacteriales bacterium]|nr:sulfite exporter TauE/SafE family protein [Ignavibacteriales bacterium]
MDISIILLISLIFFIIAVLYSSVGHGGASGYLAVLSFMAFKPDEMASTALLVNIVVAGIAFYSYFRSGYYSAKLTIPFLLTSIPLSFIGGMLSVPKNYYGVLLALALIVASLRLVIKSETVTAGEPIYKKPHPIIALPAGGLIGFISGIVGVGGGIFLSPIILLMKWADPKFTAATAALFIVVNSISGIGGRIIDGRFSTAAFMPFMAAAILGGFVGSIWGAKKFSNQTLRRLLGVVLIIAAIKLLIASL